MSLSWIKKYEPKNPEDIIGQNKAVEDLSKFITTYKTQKKKACLIYGLPGCGKTSTVLVLAKKYNCEVVEVNASDFRNADKLNKILGPALSNMSLFGKGKIILVDEVDGLSGRKDRGGVQAIVKLLATAKFPVICTANNPWESKLSSLRSKCNVIKFNTLNYLTIFNLLKKICTEEQVSFDETALKSLARRAGGDARAAINDLQTLSQVNKQITKESLESLSDRIKTESMTTALLKIFKNSDLKIALTAFDNVQENLDKCVLWIDQNLPAEYKGKDLARAYDALSKADVYKGRIRRRQHWRFLVYVNALLTAGIASAKTEKNPAFVQYKPTTRILKLWRAKMRFGKRNSIAEKLAKATHTSKQRALQQLPYLKQMFTESSLAAQLTEELDLNTEEVSWLVK